MVGVAALVCDRDVASKPSTNSWAQAMSLRWPGEPISPTGLPSTSPTIIRARAALALGAARHKPFDPFPLIVTEHVTVS
jgi:hypothetical protein